MTTEAPSGVVTFLFTDIEGSTRRWESDPEKMRAALAAHDEVLRSAIETHGGFLFKHTGDGTCTAFASPMAAVDAAGGGGVGEALRSERQAPLAASFCRIRARSGIAGPGQRQTGSSWLSAPLTSGNRKPMPHASKVGRADARPAP